MCPKAPQVDSKSLRVALSTLTVEVFSSARPSDTLKPCLLSEMASQSSKFPARRQLRARLATSPPLKFLQMAKRNSCSCTALSKLAHCGNYFSSHSRRPATAARTSPVANTASHTEPGLRLAAQRVNPEPNSNNIKRHLCHSLTAPEATSKSPPGTYTNTSMEPIPHHSDKEVFCVFA